MNLLFGNQPRAGGRLLPGIQPVLKSGVYRQTDSAVQWIFSTVLFVHCLSVCLGFFEVYDGAWVSRMKGMSDKFSMVILDTVLFTFRHALTVDVVFLSWIVIPKISGVAVLVTDVMTDVSNIQLLAEQVCLAWWILIYCDTKKQH